jgi:hypothetical protein
MTQGLISLRAEYCVSRLLGLICTAKASSKRRPGTDSQSSFEGSKTYFQRQVPMPRQPRYRRWSARSGLSDQGSANI